MLDPAERTSALPSNPKTGGWVNIFFPSGASRTYMARILRLSVPADSEGGLIFYDFGMMGEIVPATRERLLDLFYGVAKKDTDTVCLVLLPVQPGSAQPPGIDCRRPLKGGT